MNRLFMAYYHPRAGEYPQLPYQGLIITPTVGNISLKASNS